MATLADVLRQAGYVTPQGQVVGPRTDLAQKLKSYVMNIPQNAAQNLANQRADIDAALTMGQGGIEVGDRAAFERQMAQVPNLMGMTNKVPVTRKEIIEEQVKKVLPEEYRGSHTAPNAQVYGGTLDDLAKIMPADVYSSKGIRLYGIGDPRIDQEWFKAAYLSKGQPDRMVEIYRAVPKGVKDINAGDWVTTSKTYAKNHGENTLNGEYEIISKKVKAKTLSSEGYPYEFGYNE